jgi:two-component system nitrogen regulation response regulator GlnG
MPTLLVVDDEPSILHFFRRAFQRPGVKLLTAGSAADGLALVKSDGPDVAVLDIGLEDQSGLELFKRIHEVDPKLPVIFITGHGTTANAIEAMRLGAFEYLLKPLELEELIDLVERAFEISRLMRVPAVIPEGPQEPDSADAFIGRSPAMQQVFKSIGRVAPQSVTVLILGESGTGKELVARAIYHYSDRAAGPFLAINCAAIPETLLESELFGHEKGAFTGADRRRIGKFEQCRGGTLFLDEIGDMTPLTQTKILRVLQGQAFERLGGNELIETDVRIIAATNRNLEQMVADNTFRGDLYYRLNVYTIALPPLRERSEDISLLADHFLRVYGQQLRKEIHSIAPSAMEVLMRYPWPGNVRQLQSVIKQSLLQAAGSVLLSEFLPGFLLHESNEQTDASDPRLDELGAYIQRRLTVGANSLYDDVRSVVDRRLLSEVMAYSNGNLSQAARYLGISRATLRTRLADLGMAADKTP